MNKTTKYLTWSVVGLAVIAVGYYGYSAYQKSRTTSKDPEKNNRDIQVVLNK